MQRWIGLGLLTMFLVLGGGGYFALRIYKENRPQRMWVPMPINSEIPVEEHEEIAGKIRDALMKPEVLLKVSKDLDLPKKMDLPSHEQAVLKLNKVVFVEVDEADSAMGTKIPAIHVGINGTRKNQELSGKIAMRLMDDVWKLLGIKPPPKKEF
jgi:hypothetical protein